MSIVYLAHPIDLEGLGEAFRDAHRVLAEGNHTVYDPAEAWNYRGGLTQDQAASLHTANLQVLGQCDALVAVMDKPSVGVPLEILHAHQVGVPTVVYKMRGASQSLVLNALGVTLIDDHLILAEWLMAVRRGIPR